ncbi:TetR family transcriptional regulator C-terminal domain-containing protein [Kordiimonas sp. SCSIO 12610]|uniref:TetR family transcriptional regulator C-terminal domain-containing protein n=1 Tax=Kordiimonas sp. SCSIO 12610 TaxID=2829597 RepID=UPI00210A4A24|nr:TetR family transcriptional regulator C-terminal domain-containing protein [Kordiimonas sp. SCSIO 12610]UTW54829.1 TetR family transcriptional regulator C-terminal domain-containing protein [Kordiimonas sp. SCSIO 12610]
MTIDNGGDGPGRHKAGIRQENVIKILVAAETVFAEKGFNGASVDLIAKRAGVPKPNVYYYFGSKETLYRKVVEDICSIWLKAADTFDDIDDPVPAFRHYVASKMELARNRPHGSRLWAIEMASGAPFIQGYLTNTVKPWLESREKVIERWVSEGKLKPVKARYLFYMIWATTQHYADFEAQMIVMNDGQPLDEQQFEYAKETVIALILKSLDLQ